MSSSAVNMYRLVIVAIFAAFASCVLAETETPEALRKKAENCTSQPDYLVFRKDFLTCFHETVNRYLNSSIPATPGCKNFTDLENKLDVILTFPAKSCDINVTLNATVIKSLMRFSLKGDAFKKFYSKLECVKGVETNISNTCVKGNVGYFNITKERKHMSWFQKSNVYFTEHSCTKGLNVQNCVSVELHSCGIDANKFVTSLSEHVRELGNCKQFNSTQSGPQMIKNEDSTWFTTPVKITIGVGSAVVGIGMIIVLVLKFKNK